MVSNYYSNGKLLLSGEYLVLHGAMALVLPLKIGQHMKVIPTGYHAPAVIQWNAKVINEPWFHTEIRIQDWMILNSSDTDVAVRLLKILKEAAIMNHMLFDPASGFEIITDTGFDINWGFGSSSALITNIAHWALIDPFELHKRTSSGSGADIAGAVATGPVIYRLKDNKPEYYRIDFKPSFYSHIWLVYLGHKQNTAHSVQQFAVNDKVQQAQVDNINEITLQMTRADDLETFKSLIVQHETIISDILGIPVIGQSMFPDFHGEIKSLGAWGGDFIMAVTDENEEWVRNYFAQKDMHPVFSFDKLVLQ